MRKLVYFIACTADGFIARENGGFDFFPVAGDHLPFIAQEYPETITGHLRKDFGVRGENRHFSSVLMAAHLRGWIDPRHHQSVSSPPAIPHLEHVAG